MSIIDFSLASYQNVVASLVDPPPDDKVNLMYLSDLMALNKILNARVSVGNYPSDLVLVNWQFP